MTPWRACRWESERGLVPKVILFTCQYGGQIDIYLSDVFCFSGHILYLHSSYTESARGWSVKTAFRFEPYQTFMRPVRQNEMCFKCNQLYGQLLFPQKKIFNMENGGHIAAGVVSWRKLHCVLSQLYCVRARWRQYCGIHRVQKNI